MKAVVVEAFGGPEQLKVVERPDPTPAEGEAVVAVQAAGVGFVDAMAREGRYVFREPGFVPGLEAAGAVVALGAGVGPDWLGRTVLAFPSRGGGYAERLVVRASDLIPLASDVSAEEALAIGVNGLVAAFCLDRAQVAAGERVLIRGAGGGIGLMATQFAAQLTSQVTATTSGKRRGERLIALGATALWNRRTDVPLAPESFDVLIDAIGGPEVPACIGLLRANGRYVLCGGIEGAPPADFGLTMIERFHQSLTFAVLSLNSIPTASSIRRIAPLLGALRERKISGPIDSRFPLGAAAAAHARLQSGEAFGKILLTT